MMTQHDAFTQGFQDTARAHYGAGSDVLSELDAINQRAKEYERNKRSAVTPYQPGTVIEYAPPAPKPYANNADAIAEMVPALLKLGVGVIGGTAIAGGAVWVWNALTVTAAVVSAPVVVGTAVAAPAVGFSTMTIVGCIVALIAFLWFVLSGMAGGCETRQGAKTEHHHHYYQYNNQGPGGQQNAKQ